MCPSTKQNEGSKIMKLEIVHIDTCLPDYWSGHHCAHVQIPIIPGMSMKDIKEAIKHEIAQGAVMGSDDIAFLLASDYVGAEREDEAVKVTKAVYAAINRMRPARKGQRRFFTDIEANDEDTEPVYAFFLIVEV